MSPSRPRDADMFSAIGDPNRRRILELLSAAERSVGELAAELGIAQPSVTQHLTVLRAVGLVASRRDGTRSIYSVTPDALSAVTEWIARVVPPSPATSVG